MPNTRKGTSIIAGTVAAAALAGGIAVAAQPASAAATARQAASSTRCVYFGGPTVNGVRIRTAPSTSARVKGYAYKGQRYTLDGCAVREGSWYVNVNGYRNNSWIPVKYHGVWRWTAVGDWWS